MQEMRLDDWNSHVRCDVPDECFFVMAVIGEDISLEENIVVGDE